MMNLKLPIPGIHWITEEGCDIERMPIDSVLRQALSDDEQQFRTGCSLLNSLCGYGRAEAGVFLLGLLRCYPHDLTRLTCIVQSLSSYPSAQTVTALADELRRVKGSNTTRGYLLSIVKTLKAFPFELVNQEVEQLCADRQIGVRLRQRLQSLTEVDQDGW